MNQEKPFFSILILCWNSNQTINKCLDALRTQTFQDFEIILVDNGSEKPIPITLIAEFPTLQIKFHPLKENLGFAGGNNYAASKAGAEYLVLLNADAFPNAQWLEKIHQAVKKYSGCFFVSKQIMAENPERLDGTGDVYHFTGLVWRRSYNQLVSIQQDKEGEVFSACGATAVYPTRLFMQVNGFDEDFFSYVEDIDLSFRLRLLGCRCIYLPDAVVDHLGSASTYYRSNLSVYYGQRNLVWTFIKDVPGIWLWLLAPAHILANLLIVLVYISRNQGRVVLRAKGDALRGLGIVIKKRRLVQSTRSATAWKVIKTMDWNPFSPFTKLIRR
jgi:GT2 family glycosyltransferase